MHVHLNVQRDLQILALVESGDASVEMHDVVINSGVVSRLLPSSPIRSTFRVFPAMYEHALFF